MKIEVWSDIACPWCYIGRRRLERALAQFEHADQVEIIWRSFELDPDAPPSYDGKASEMLAAKYGIPVAEAEAMQANVTELAAQEGLDYRFDRAQLANSFDAHRLLHFAHHHGVQGEMKERIQKAYFTDGLLVSDHNTLVQLATDVGLDANETRQMLTSNAYATHVYADVRKAQRIGVRGVPFFLFEDKYAVSGAQAAEVFTLALERTWSEFSTVVEIVGSDEASLCSDDNCAV